MKKLQNLKTIIDSIGIGGAALIADLVKTYAAAQNWNQYIPIILFVSVTIVLSPIISLTGSLLVNKSRSVRKALLGSEFIEGYWTDYTTRNELKKTFGIITITYNNGGYTIQGNDYLEDGTLESSFHSTALESNWPSILFVHKANRISKEGHLVDGFSQFTFALIGGQLTYAGWSVDYGKKAHQIQSGRRLMENELKLCHSKKGRAEIFNTH